MRKTGSLAGVGEAVFEGGMLLPPLPALWLPASSSAVLVFDLSWSGDGAWSSRGSFGGVFSRRCSPPPFLAFLLGKGGFGGGEDAEAAAFCISRCTTSSAILGEGGDGGDDGAVVFSSWTILFSTGSYRCSLRNGRRLWVKIGSSLM